MYLFQHLQCWKKVSERCFPTKTSWQQMLRSSDVELVKPPVHKVQPLNSGNFYTCIQRPQLWSASSQSLYHHQGVLHQSLVVFLKIDMNIQLDHRCSMPHFNFRCWSWRQGKDENRSSISSSSDKLSKSSSDSHPGFEPFHDHSAKGHFSKDDGPEVLHAIHNPFWSALDDQT